MRVRHDDLQRKTLTDPERLATTVGPLAIVEQPQAILHAPYRLAVAGRDLHVLRWSDLDRVEFALDKLGVSELVMPERRMNPTKSSGTRRS